MSGTVLTTVSPSRVTISRSTPCVEGCCGPMLMVMVSTRLVSPTLTLSVMWSSVCSPSCIACILGRLLARFLVVARGAGPVLWHNQTTEVRVPGKGDTKEIVDLALVPVGSGPDSADGGNGRGFLARQANARFQPNDRARFHRKQMIDDIEAWLALRPVHCCQVRHVIIPQRGVIAQKCGNCWYFFRRKPDGGFAAMLSHLQHGLAKLGPYRFYCFCRQVLCGFGHNVSKPSSLSGFDLALHILHRAHLQRVGWVGDAQANLFLELVEAIEQHIRRGWAAGNEDIDRNHLIHTLHNCVIVEDAAA